MRSFPARWDSMDLRGWRGNPGGRVHPARRSAGTFRFQPLAAITIPTSVSMNIAAAVFTGDISGSIMIGR